MDDADLAEVATAREVLIVTSTFGDGGPPDNGADFWGRLQSPDAPSLYGVRYAVLGIGDRSYDNFCGHAKSLDARLTDLGATKLVDRAECEAYDDEPMVQWADRVVDLVGAPATRSRAQRRPPDAEPFTRAHPVIARRCAAISG